MGKILYSPTTNQLQKALGAELAAGATSSVTLNSVTGIPNLPGIMLIDNIDTNGDPRDSSLREYIQYTGTSGSTLTGLTRGLGGTTDQIHSVGAVVEFVPDVVWATRVSEALATVVTDADHQAVNTTNIVTPSGTQVLTNKTLTSPTINTGTLDSPVINTAISGTAILDEDDMVSNSATKVPTQQSVKAYVDASAGQTVSSVRATDFSTSSGTAVDLVTVAITLAAGTSGKVKIWCSVGGQDASGWGARLVKDSTTLAGLAGATGVIGGGKGCITIPWRETGLSAGTYTYKLQVRAAGTFTCNPSSAIDDNFASIIVEEEP